MRRASGLVLTLSLALVVMLSSGVAGADRRHHSHKNIEVDSKVSIKFRGGGDDPYAEQPNFSGKVGANARRGGSGISPGDAEAACIKRRDVEIFRKNGPRIARTTTDANGEYGTLAGSKFVAGARYFARVRGMTLRRSGVKIECERASSEVITAG